MWTERKYAAYGRILMAGGAGLLYFTVYAMYFFSATGVLHSQVVDLLLLCLVAAGVIVYSLRYRSEAVTFGAFALGYLTAHVGSITEFSLGALLLLTAALAVVCIVRGWNVLLGCGLLATYLTHFRWVVSAAPGAGHERALIALLLLTAYWVLYALPPLLAHPAADSEIVPTAEILGVLNGIFWVALAGGTLERLIDNPWAVALFAAVVTHTALTVAARLRSRRLSLQATYGAMAAVFHTLGVKIHYDGLVAVALWLLPAAGSVWIANRGRVTWLRVTALIVYWLPALHYLATPRVHGLPGSWAGTVFSAIWPWLPPLALVAVAVWARATDRDQREPATDRVLTGLANGIAIVVIWTAFHILLPESLRPIMLALVAVLIASWSAVRADRTIQWMGAATAAASLVPLWNTLSKASAAWPGALDA